MEAAGMPIYSDNCGAEDCWGMSSLTVWSEDGPWTPTCEADDENAEGTKSLERTWYVQDRCGNIGEAVQWITVKDETAPEGTVEDASVACAVYDANTAYGSTSQTDNCDSECGGVVGRECHCECGRRGLLPGRAHLHVDGRLWKQLVCHPNHHGVRQRPSRGDW